MFPYDSFTFLIKGKNFRILLIINVTDMLSPEQASSEHYRDGKSFSQLLQNTIKNNYVASKRYLSDHSH